MVIVTLKNGEQVAATLVPVIMLSLSDLMERDPITFYEAVQIARDPAHKPWDAARLQAAAMIDNAGTMHDSIRSIIISAVRGEDLKMTLESPIAG